MIAARLSPSSGIRLARRLVIILESGKPLPTGLRMADEELGSRSAVAVARCLADDVERGLSLAQAAENQRCRLPTRLYRVLSLPLANETLCHGLRQMITHEELAWQVRRRLVLAIGYPALIMFGVALWLLLMSRGIVLPLARDLAHESALANHITPAVSQISLGFLLEPLAGALLACVAILGFSLVSSRFSRGGRLVAHLPVVGELYRTLGEGDFCSALANYLELQVPLPSAIRYAGEGSLDSSLRAAASEVAIAVERGAKLSQSLAERHEFVGLARRVANLEANPDLLKTGLQGLAEEAHGRGGDSCSWVGIAAPTMAYLLLFAAVMVVVQTLAIHVMNFTSLAVE